MMHRNKNAKIGKGHLMLAKRLESAVFMSCQALSLPAAFSPDQGLFFCV